MVAWGGGGGGGKDKVAGIVRDISEKIYIG